MIDPSFVNYKYNNLSDVDQLNGLAENLSKSNIALSKRNEELVYSIESLKDYLATVYEDPANQKDLIEDMAELLGVELTKTVSFDIVVRYKGFVTCSADEDLDQIFENAHYSMDSWYGDTDVTGSIVESVNVSN
jgi:hypothetical protein